MSAVGVVPLWFPACKEALYLFFYLGFFCFFQSENTNTIFSMLLILLLDVGWLRLDEVSGDAGLSVCQPASGGVSCEVGWGCWVFLSCLVLKTIENGDWTVSVVPLLMGGLNSVVFSLFSWKRKEQAAGCFALQYLVLHSWCCLFL